jgi:tRNA threonylcarbamoyladenosine biosynthesis protein TsaE
VRAFVTDGPEGTERAGAELAAGLKPGDVVLVSGELGAGKTTFVRGALRALGVTGPITSPTFVVGHLYETSASNRENRPPGDSPSDGEPSGRVVAHLDLYRLAGMDAEDPGLLDDYFAPEAIVFVEWPEHAQDAFPPERVAHRVRLSHAGGDDRRVETS